MNKNTEYTYVMIKPDVSKNSEIVEKIKDMLQGIGMEIVVTYQTEKNPMGYITLNDQMLEQHYGHVKKYGEDIYNGLVEFMKSGYVIPMVLYGDNAIENVRKLVGVTDSSKAEIGTIRRSFGLDKQKNAIHASDSEESVIAEIGRFFDGMMIADLDEYRYVTGKAKIKTKKIK